MRASYKKLWKLLVDKDMSKGDLHKASGLTVFQYDDEAAKR